MKLLNPRTRMLLYTGILALAYFVTGKLAVSMLGLVKAEPSPVWPPAGIALAALLLQGRRMWPGIVLGFGAVKLYRRYTVGCHCHISL